MHPQLSRLCWKSLLNLYRSFLRLRGIFTVVLAYGGFRCQKVRRVFLRIRDLNGNAQTFVNARRLV